MNKLLLLHGALGSTAQLVPLQNALSTALDTYSINFSGHGGLPLPGQYDFDLFAKDIINWLDEHELQSIDLFGYSMGGYAALYLAHLHPERVGKIFTLGSKLKWAVEEAQTEIKMMNPEVIEEKLPAFADILKRIHSPQDWKKVMALTADMMLYLGKEGPLTPEVYQSIEHDVTLAIGDKDNMAGVEDTFYTYRLLPNARFMVLPNTPHPLDKVKLDRLAPELIRFFEG